MSTVARKPGLDVLRVVAIALVMLHHFRHLPGCPDWLRWFGLHAYIGVDLFFVLSGWLIGGQLLRSTADGKPLDLRRFWIRRWVRTVPAYLAMLVLLAIVGVIPLRQVPAMLFFAQNYSFHHTWIVTWSLCVEEHFYLALPLVLLGLGWLRRRSASTAVLVVIALLAGSFALRWATWQFEPPRNYDDYLSRLYVPTHLRVDGLAIGVFFAWLSVNAHPIWHALQRHARTLAVLGAGLVVASTWNPLLVGTGVDHQVRMRFFTAVPSFLLVSIGVGLLLPLAARAATTPRRVHRLLASGADLAFGLYLTHTHMPGIVAWIGRSVTLGFWERLGLAGGLSLLAAMALRQLVENPGLALRDRLLSFAAAPATPRPGPDASLQ